MNVGDQHSRSLWMNETPAMEAAALAADEACDVAVIGSGIAGLSTAYELALAMAKARGRNRLQLDPGAPALH